MSARSSGTPPAAVSATTTAMVFDKHFQLPMVQQGSRPGTRGGRGDHGQRDLRDEYGPAAAELDGHQHRAINWNGRCFSCRADRSAQRSAGRWSTERRSWCLLYTARMSTNYGPVTDIPRTRMRPTTGWCWRRGGAAGWAGWSFAPTRRGPRRSWTMAEQFGAVLRTNGQFDPFTIRYDRGLSTLNVAHKVTATAVWLPTVAMPERWMRTAANGWSIAPWCSPRRVGGRTAMRSSAARA